MKTKSFTLIEILFAIVILAMSLGVTLAISAQSKGELIRAKDRWIIQHTLEQATEYFLLTHPDDLKIPDEFLPDGFDADCEIEVVDQGLPEFADVEEYKGWKLGVYTITIYDQNGNARGQQIVHKVIPENMVF